MVKSKRQIKYEEELRAANKCFYCLKVMKPLTTHVPQYTTDKVKVGIKEIYNRKTHLRQKIDIIKDEKIFVGCDVQQLIDATTPTEKKYLSLNKVPKLKETKLDGFT